MLAFVDRAFVAPSRPTNPSLARELGFLISDTSCLDPPRRSQQIDSHGSIKSRNTSHIVQNHSVPQAFVVGKELRLFVDEKSYAHEPKSLNIKK